MKKIKNSFKKIGNNYKIKNCPVLIPSENMKFFTLLQKSNTRLFQNITNSYNH